MVMMNEAMATALVFGNGGGQGKGMKAQWSCWKCKVSFGLMVKGLEDEGLAAVVEATGGLVELGVAGSLRLRLLGFLAFGWGEMMM
ncbi:hypothetical protein V6N11_037003 [Hibiscus sabdariffa]|uniref:Uncharacterized protein n=1 Tax=Hibiscus sabdariffa TaxID=183260 RepID=A0ABR2RC21_9ROSI